METLIISSAITVCYGHTMIVEPTKLLQDHAKKVSDALALAKTEKYKSLLETHPHIHLDFYEDIKIISHNTTTTLVTTPKASKLIILDTIIIS